MATEQVRRAALSAAWVGGLAAFIGLALCAEAEGQYPNDGKTTFPDAPKGPFKLTGVLECQRCHNERNPADNPALTSTKSIDFVRMTENRIWGSHDLHSRAYQNLTGPLGQQMERVLATGRGDTGYKVTKDTACLACHATIRDPSQPITARNDKSFSTFEGVTCEMCHGYASKWANEHAKIEENDGRVSVPWREWPPSVKTSWGLVDIRDPKVRADKCASCHVGNLSEGRFVTHEMFAAGHPPLPPLDVNEYARDQPRHWGLPGEMRYHTALARSNPEKEWALFHYRDESEEVYAARQFAESTAATFKASVRLLGQEAAGPDGSLDFAAFDCYACHHDLKYPSARQARGYTGIPGRPTFRPSMLSLVKIIADHAAGMPGGDSTLKGSNNALDATYYELTGAFATRTFGDPAKVKAASDKLERWADGLLAGLGKVKYTGDQTRKLLAAVVAAGANDKAIVADPETAQLLTWAAESLSEGLNKSGPKPPAEFASVLKGLDKLVVARLRNDPMKTKPIQQGVDDPLNPRGKVNETPIPVEDRLKERMQLFNGFDPIAFRADFRKLKTLVPEQK